MAVQFELYKTPMPKEKKNKTRYHARPVSFETVNTEKLAYRIHDRSTLKMCIRDRFYAVLLVPIFLLLKLASVAKLLLRQAIQANTTDTS